MAASEIPVQYERDLRSASHGAKRAKDHSTKWALGVREGPGVKLVVSSNPLERQQFLKSSNNAKVRPDRQPTKHERETVNLNRERSHVGLSRGRADATFGARDEIRNAPQSKSIIDLLSASSNRGDAAEDFLYSFDNTDSPAPALTLDAFVKPRPRETEKLVAKEYEILDANGDAVRGKRARRTLRQAASASPEARPQPAVLEEDDFELV